MKTVTIHSTTGDRKEINTNAATWIELQAEMKEAGVSFGGMKAVVGETKNTLESKGALLPEGNFNLFLMPTRTKSGATPKKKDAAPAKKPAAKKEAAPKKAAPKKDAKETAPKKAAPTAKKPVEKKTTATKKAESTKKPSQDNSTENAGDLSKQEAPIAGFGSKGVITKDQLKPQVQGDVENKEGLSDVLGKAAKEAVKETIKELSDAERLGEVLKLIDDVKHMGVRPLLTKIKTDLEDAIYMVKTGKSRIDNLKAKNIMDEFRSDIPGLR